MSETRDVLKAGDLAVTLATWVFLLDQRGVRPGHDALRSACDALVAAGKSADDVDWGALGEALVQVVRGALPDESADAVSAWVASIYGAAHITGDPLAGCGGAGPREQRLAAARSYQFKTGLPWLARIFDRFPDGSVGPHWVLVEQITDVVTAMDPYPWDDLEEEYQAPVADFMVKWELSGCTTIRWVA